MAEQIIRALIVEDDPSWQQILTEIIEDSGLQVDLASNYPEAVDLIRRSSHRVAVLDLSLGGPDHHNQDGIRTAEAIRRYDPGCVVLFLTGFATVELAVQVMQELGAYTCLRKEVFRRAEFRKVIGQALAQAPLPTTRQSIGNAADQSLPAAPVPADSTTAGQDTVLVVEDDAGWRSLITELIEDAGLRARTSTSYVEAVGLLKRSRYQMAVIDLSLASSLNEENTDGFRLLVNLQKANIPVVIVSGLVDPPRIEQAYSDQLLFACIEKQSFDRSAFLSTVKQALQKGGQDPVLSSLTDREREVLALLAQGLTNKEIARELTITTNTVKRHLKSLFAKLSVNTRSAASARAISMGFGADRQ